MRKQLPVNWFLDFRKTIIMISCSVIFVPTNFQYLYNSGVGLKNLRKFSR